MTYPPQQPGPYGPQDPYGQQPYGQQQPPYGQQPYGQQQYGPQWGQQPGGFPPEPPPKKKTGLIVTLIIVAVLVIGGGGFAAWWFLLKDDAGGGDDLRATADSFTKELSTALSAKLDDVDLAPLESLTCDKDYKQLTDELKSARETDESTKTPEKATFGVKNFKADGDKATFDMTQKRGSTSGDDLKMDVVKEGDGFVACGLYKERTPPPTGEDSEGNSPSSESEDDGPANDGSIPNPIPKTS